jgi:hypothetical protein
MPFSFLVKFASVTSIASPASLYTWRSRRLFLPVNDNPYRLLFASPPIPA